MAPPPDRLGAEGPAVFGIRRPGLVVIVLLAAAILVMLLAYMFLASGLWLHTRDYIMRPGR